MKNPLIAFLLALGIAGSLFAGSASAVELTLQGGWTNAPFATSNAEVFLDGNIVHFKGAIAGGTSADAFTLPPYLRPYTRVYVPVDLYLAKKGRLIIEPTGVVSVQAQNAFSDAQSFTSLDGAKFALHSSGFTGLTLANGWTGSPFATSIPGARLFNGIVYLTGAMAGGSNGYAFTLPLEMRPATDVYLPVDLCGAKKGRLYVQTNGNVTVVAEVDFADAQCFTSLDGVSFAPSASGSTALTLENGWTNYTGTSTSAAHLIDGIVHFKGAIAGGISGYAFQLPPAMRPTTNVYVPIDLCNAKKGRLNISPNGGVTVQAELAFADAQCFSSLDGASFVTPPPSEFTPLPLLNGWIDGTYGTQTTSVVLYDGIVHFKGALTSGSNEVLFKLPVTLRQVTTVYVSVDLCLAKKGRLNISPTGEVSVEAEVAFTDAQCFTSLEGASFALPDSGYTALTLENGWSRNIVSTIPGAKLINGIVHFKGGITGGDGGYAFTLPPTMRPTTNVYVRIDMCNSKKGRLNIQPSGAVSVQAEFEFSSAQCFSSLDGAKFALNSAGFAPLGLVNGWTNTPFGTSSPAASILRNIVYLKGAISGGTSTLLFTLPPILRPEGVVYAPIDLCNAKKGRLVIQPNGTVEVQAESAFSDAQCFTSLDGAAYAVPEPWGPTALLSGLLLLGWLAERRARRARRQFDDLLSS